MASIDEIRDEFKRFAPHYAEAEAEAAFDKVVELQEQGVLRPGLYYVVLVDLVGSTTFMTEFGNEAARVRIKGFVKAAIGSIGGTQGRLRNLAVFIKEIGDAALLLFQTFPDVIEWQSRLEIELAGFARSVGQPRLEVRTCIHIGDVLLDGVNPVALAVSQLFKIEKTVESGDICLTDPAYQAAWPTLGSAYHAFEDVQLVKVEGFPDEVMLHRLIRERHASLLDFVNEGHVEYQARTLDS